MRALYVSFRQQGIGGGVGGPYLLEADPEAVPLTLTPRDLKTLNSLVAGKDVLFATHGFNVDRENGVRSLGRLGAGLALSANEFFLGVLWPGDWWVPAVNYPFEGATAIATGKLLANLCNTLTAARSFSFASHSLGARVVLQAVSGLNKPARVVCLMAGAINDDCLAAEYQKSDANAQSIQNLASRKDRVLQLAYPVGDIIADILHDDHAFGEQALGRNGPAPSLETNIAASQIPDRLSYGHGSYLPPSSAGAQPATGSWTSVTQFVLRAFRRETELWPPVT